MIKKIIAVFLVIAAIYWSFLALLPTKISDLDAEKKHFSTERALIHLKQISQEPHAVGSMAHADVRTYIVSQLEGLGLTTQIQEGYTISKWGNFAKPKNILARIKGSGSGKALMLLSHYDSAPHSSFGASDAGSGVVTILEGLRAYLAEGKIPKNDIIILITDAEELGLNGADLFVNKHEWAKDVGLVLNFEARGSGGPGVMLLETNNGNANLIDAFVEANPSHPVGNSLAYSIYKMLPNDTDLTRFREDGDIDGFNFAFIEDHYDYHTANDTYERLDRNTLEHQGTYLMALLHYFADTNLNNLKSFNDKVYFNVPLFKTVTYSYDYIWPMLILALIIFGALVFLGFKKRRFAKLDVAKGFIPLLLSIVVSLITGYMLWEFIKWINPNYREMLHGFTYNGNTYIAAFVCVSIGICLWIYSRYYKPGNTASIMVGPLVLWIVFSFIMAIFLKGASFFIIPVYFGLLSLFVLIRQRKPNLALMALLNFPLIVIMSPFIKMFPVGLGFFMDIGFANISVKLVSILLVVMMFGLLISIFGFFRHKRRWAYLMFLIGFSFMLSAQFKSNFNNERPRPNSLVYLLDIDKNEAQWATYDHVLDDYTKQALGDDPDNASDVKTNLVGSKYNSGFTYSKKADLKAFIFPEVEVYRDTVINNRRKLSVYIAAKRDVQRMELFSDTQNVFHEFIINGVSAYKTDTNANVFTNRRSNRLLSYFVSDNDPLDIKIVIPKGQRTELILYESSNDLLTNSSFSLNQRSEAMIPKPFVLNDAVILKKTIVLN